VVRAVAVTIEDGGQPVPALLLNPMRPTAGAIHAANNTPIIQLAIEAVAKRGSIPQGLGTGYTNYETKNLRDDLRKLKGPTLIETEEAMGMRKHDALLALCRLDQTRAEPRASEEQDLQACLDRQKRQKARVLALWDEDAPGSRRAPGSRFEAMRHIAAYWPWLFLDLDVVEFLRENELRLYGKEFSDIFPLPWRDLLPKAFPSQVSLMAAHAARLGWLPACRQDIIIPGSRALYASSLAHEELALADAVERYKRGLENRDDISYAHVNEVTVAALLLTEDALATGKLTDDGTGESERYLKKTLKRIRDQKRSREETLLGPVLLPFGEDSPHLMAFFQETLANPELDESDYSNRWNQALRRWAKTEAVCYRLMTLVLGDPDRANIPLLYKAHGEALRDALPPLE
jgi:hypothetical protein